MGTDGGSGARLVVIEPVVRRVIRGRVPEGAVDDLVQETLVRLSRAAETMTADELQAYAAVSARNAAASYHRTTGRHRRLEVGMVDLTQPEGPDSIVLDREEAETMQRVLASMDAEDRALLEAHHVDDRSVATIARGAGRSEMAVRLHLSRARTRLRVDYTLARWRADLPTDRCRPVLLAISSGDRRAQDRLAAHDHIDHCEACAELIASATGKDRPAIGLLAFLGWRWKDLSRAGRVALSFGSAVAVTGAVAAATVVAVRHDPQDVAATATTTAGTSATTDLPGTTGATGPRGTGGAASSTIAVPGTGSTLTTAPPSGATGQVRVSGGPLPSSASGLAGAVGQDVTAKGARVLSVPSDEGFWVGSVDGGRIWVQLVATAGESPVTIEPGASVTFRGRVVAHGPDLAQRIGVTQPEGGDELTAQGHHVNVALRSIRAS